MAPLSTLWGIQIKKNIFQNLNHFKGKANILIISQKPGFKTYLACLKLRKKFQVV